MTTIQSVVLKNFKRFEALDLPLNPERTLLIGDNESGKSSILKAMDLVLGASRSRVESLGLETLFNRAAVQRFLVGGKRIEDLPKIEVELYLAAGTNPELNGKNNSKGVECDGLSMVCRPAEEFSAAIAEILKEKEANFPFEYYEIVFKTFSDASYNAFNRLVRHLMIDSSKIDSEYASREYTRSLYEVNTEPASRYQLENQYRRSKEGFGEDHLKDLNSKLPVDCKFALRTSTKANLGTDLVITEQNIPIDDRGKGRQCFVKTDFALRKSVAKKGVDTVLLEEPENHLSHGYMKQLIERIAESKRSQLIITTHSSLVSSRLDLRTTILLAAGDSTAFANLQSLDKETADFFMRAPNHNILEFVLAKKVILVEGDAEFMLLDTLYRNVKPGSTLDGDKVHVCSVGGTSFKRYMALAKLLSIRTAVIRDNDGDYEAVCVERYAEFVDANIKVFADKDKDRRTFEICLYRDNTSICDEVFKSSRRKLSVEGYMLAEKTEAALELIKHASASKLVAPSYIKEAIEWISA